MTPFAKRGGRVKEEERGQLGLGGPPPRPRMPSVRGVGFGGTGPLSLMVAPPPA